MQTTLDLVYKSLTKLIELKGTKNKNKLGVQCDKQELKMAKQKI